MRTFCIHFIACLTLLAFSFPTCTAQNSPRKQINIDENWKFHFGNASDPLKDFNYSIATIFSKSGGAWGTAIEPRFNDSSWRTLNLPHDWAVELPFANVKDENVESHGYKPVGRFISRDQYWLVSKTFQYSTCGFREQVSDSVRWYFQERQHMDKWILRRQ